MSKPGKPQKQQKSTQKLSKKKILRAQDDKELEQLKSTTDELDPQHPLSLFEELPLSKHTSTGLSKAYFTSLTPVQARSIVPALQGRDILAAAPTGSGKTLAFLIPVLDILYRRQWSSLDGLGALIISPTRELAVQIFKVLRDIGQMHSLSAGLLIGGKSESLKEEKARLGHMNIVVATPGRLLQHMDQTYGFESDNLQLLVLDEADRILDMGFAADLNAIIGHLPPHRQTLLFSATQTKSIADLARLSLRQPYTVDVSSSSSLEGAISDDKELHLPKDLEQHYMVVDLPEKLNMLWSFIKTHLTYKTLVFISSCKQVRHIFETFRHLRPGVPLLQLHGKQKQNQRLEIYTRFSAAKNGILFATDIASRGLDFAGVSWVVQIDCPEDTNTYVHRVGRTARYQSRGKALMFLTPSEEDGMCRRLKERGIQVNEIRAKPNKQQSIRNSLQSYAFQYPEIKFLAQRAFISYVRSIYLQKDKTVFKFADVPLEEYANSLGLVGAPKVTFVGKQNEARSKHKNNTVQNGLVVEKKKKSKKEKEGEEHMGDDDEKEDSEKKDVKTKYDRMFGRKNQSILSEHFSKVIDREQNGEDDDFITISRRDHDLDGDNGDEDDDITSGPMSKRQLIRMSKKKSRAAMNGEQSTKLIFDEEGEAHPIYELKDAEAFEQEGDANELGREFVLSEKANLAKQDIEDRKLARQKLREKKQKRKREYDEEEEEGDGNNESRAVLGGDDEYDEYRRDEKVFAPLSPASDNDNSDDEGLEARALAAMKRRRI